VSAEKIMSELSANPKSLLLVRSTLEMVAVMKRLHPAAHSELEEIEAEVRRGGQLLIDAGSIPRARVALETIHRARLRLQAFDKEQDRLAA